MEVTLTTNQKIALAQHINFLITGSGSMCKWNSQLWGYFSDYKPYKDQHLEHSNYVRTLKALPIEAKRDYICTLLIAWAGNTKHDLFTLYDTFQSIMYLKIGGGVECVLFNLIINLASYYSGYSFYLYANANDYYTVDMVFDVDELDSFSSDRRKIHFSSSSLREIPHVHFYIPSPLLKLKMNYSDIPDRQDVSELKNILKKNHTETHCPWTYLNYSLRCNYVGPFEAYLSFQFNDIEYVDNNG